MTVKESTIKEMIYVLDREREISKRWQMLYEIHPSPSCFWSKERQLVNCNIACVKLFGLEDKREFLHRFYELSPMHQPCGTLSTEKAMMLVDKAFREKEINFEWLHNTIDGEKQIPCEVVLKRIDTENTQILAGFTFDMRPIKEAKSRLLDISGRTRHILQSVPMAVNFFNESLRVLDCNQASIEMFGFSSRREYLKSFHNRIPNTQPDGVQSQDILRELVKNALATGGSNCDFLFQGADGAPIPAKLTCVSEHSERAPIIIVYFQDLRAAGNQVHIQQTLSFTVEAGPLPTGQTPNVPRELMDAFCRDAVRIHDSIENIIEGRKFDNGILRQYTALARAIKVALISIGEDELSDTARFLECAGRDGDIAAIEAESHYFLENLKDITLACTDEKINHSATDYDNVLLSDKLSIIKNACINYNKREAKRALSDLQKYTWSQHTTSLLRTISVLLLHSDFEEAADLARQGLI